MRVIIDPGFRSPFANNAQFETVRIFITPYSIVQCEPEVLYRLKFLLLFNK